MKLGQMKKDRSTKKGIPILILMYLINGIAATAIFCIFMRKEVLYGSHGELAALCVGELFCLYGGICTIRLQHVFENEKEISKRLHEIEIKINEFHNEYLKIINYKETIGCMRHDIANHIIVVESVLPKDGRELNALIDIKRNLQKKDEFKYCSNKMLDIAFEKKIKQLEEKGLRIDTDIRIKNIENRQCERLCLLMWMMIDNAANYMVKNEKIVIKVFESSIGSKYNAVSFLIKGYSEKLNHHIMKSGMEMKITEYLIDSMEGSILISEEGNCTAQAGMVEVKHIYD